MPVAAEEPTTIKVKGLAEPVRCYKVQRLYDHLAEEGTVIREDREGLKFHLPCKSPTWKMRSASSKALSRLQA